MSALLLGTMKQEHAQSLSAIPTASSVLQRRSKLQASARTSYFDASHVMFPPLQKDTSCGHAVSTKISTIVAQSNLIALPLRLALPWSRASPSVPQHPM